MASADIGTLRTRLSWEDEGANKSLEGFRRDLKGLRSEMSLAKSHGKEYANSLKGMREQSDILSRRFKTQEERVKELRKRYEESVKVKGQDANATRDLQAQLNNATAEMNRTENQLKNLNAEIKRMESPWTKLGGVMTSTGEKFQAVGQHMTEFGRNYSMKVTAPIVAGGVAVFKASMDFESAFAGVRKTVDTSEEGFKKLEAGIRAMAKELPASASDIAAVAESAGQLGIAEDKILSFSRTIIDLGESTNMTREQAATEFARFANIVGMSQDDFDRLGSSIVGLGNTMATTESEIMSMGMRLAAQGAQVGMTEAQIMALAGTMSSLGIQAEMGGTAMTTILKKIDSAVGEGGKSLSGFAKAAGVSSKEFAKAWKEDPIVALDLFVKGLDKSSKEGKNLTSILTDLGIKGVYESDVLLRMAGASDLLSDAVATSTKAWKDNVALSDEAAQRYATTESQLKMLWNRVMDVAITLGDALIPAVMSAIDAASPLIEKIESGAKAFSEMDKEQQLAIIKMVALTAAIGPASIALGGLTTGIGGVLKIGGSLSTLIGKSGGAGLAGRIGLLGMGTNPVGLAVLGVGALTFGLYKLNEASKESSQRALEVVESRKKELLANEELVASFEALQRKNRLSTDEMLRYMDILTELKNTKSEEAIKALTDEQAALLEKSGLTNDEMEQFLALNDKIVEKAPEAAKAISDQGNAYASVLDEIKKLNAAERERFATDTYKSIRDEMDKQTANLEKQSKLSGEISNMEKERSNTLNELNSVGREIAAQDLVIADIRKQMATATGEHYEKLWMQERIESDILVALKDQEYSLERQLGKLDSKLEKKQKSLKETEKELSAFDSLLDEYAQMILYEQGIVAEKGKAVQKLQEEQRNIDTARAKLEEMKRAQQISTFEYQEQNKQLNEQQGKIDTATRKLEQMNEVAGRTVYKTVEITTSPTPDTLNSWLAQRVTKQVDVVQRVSGPQMYAKGTNFHPGGDFIAGEEGYELGRMGSRWEMLNFGFYNRPAGYQVFTHDESKRIIDTLNKTPGYATGARPAGEANRIVNNLSNRDLDINIIGQLSGVITSSKNVAKELMDGVEKILMSGAKKVNAQVANVKADAGRLMLNEVSKILTDGAKKTNADVAAINKKAADEARKLETRAAQDIAAIHAKAKKAKRSLTQQEAVKIQRIEQNTAEKVKKINEKANADLVKSTEELYQKRMSALKGFIASKKEFEEMSMLLELNTWRRSIDAFKAGTQEKAEAQLEYKRMLERVNKEVESITQNHVDKVKSINDKLKNDIASVWKSYEDTVQNVANSNFNFAGLFEKAEVQEAISKNEMLDNLEGQVVMLSKFGAELDLLRKRGLDAGIIEELEKMGAKALPAVQEMNRMTDQELDKYSDLFRIKYEQARKNAEASLVDLKKNAEKEIQDLQAVANKELEILNKDTQAQLNKLTQNANSELKTLNQIGKDAIAGLMAGMASMEGPLKDQSAQMAKIIEATIKDVLKVKSPSQVGVSITEYFGDGMVIGLQNRFNAVKLKARELAGAVGSAIVPDLPNYAYAIPHGGAVSHNQPQQPIIHIHPAPVVLEGRTVGEVVFDIVDGMQSSQVNAQLYMRGLT